MIEEYEVTRTSSDNLVWFKDGSYTTKSNVFVIGTKAPENRTTRGECTMSEMMRRPKIEKVVINIGVGEAGERLAKAQKVLQMLTEQVPMVTHAKVTNRDLGVRFGMPIGCKVTLRGEVAEDFLKRALSIRENRVATYSFDKEGNLSFGISDYTDFAGMKYDP